MSPASPLGPSPQTGERLRPDSSSPQTVKGGDQRAAIRRLLGGYSVEITTSRSALDQTAGLAKGSEVYVAAIPGTSHHDTVAAARDLKERGLTPVPHVVARNVLSHTQLNDLLARLEGDAGVTRALVIGGDVAHPLGPYDSSLQLIQTGLFQKHGIHHIGLGCYPEGHPRVSQAVLEEALRDKLAAAAEAGLTPWLVSQFCFDAAQIVHFAQSLRASGAMAPLRVGLAGPASRRTLWKYAMQCGIGNSIRALGQRADAFAHLLVRDTPDALIGELAVALEQQQPDLGIAGIHLFTFGGVADSAKWADALIAG